YVEDEVCIEQPIHHFVGSLTNRGRDLGVLEPHIGGDCCHRAFEQPERPNETPVEAESRDGKVVHRALRGGAIEGVRGNLDLPHRVLLDAKFSHTSEGTPSTIHQFPPLPSPPTAVLPQQVGGEIQLSALPAY